MSPSTRIYIRLYITFRPRVRGGSQRHHVTCVPTATPQLYGRCGRGSSSTYLPCEPALYLICACEVGNGARTWAAALAPYVPAVSNLSVLSLNRVGLLVLYSLLVHPPRHSECIPCVSCQYLLCTCSTFQNASVFLHWYLFISLYSPVNTRVLYLRRVLCTLCVTDHQPPFFLIIYTLCRRSCTIFPIPFACSLHQLATWVQDLSVFALMEIIYLSS